MKASARSSSMQCVELLVQVVLTFPTNCDMMVGMRGVGQLRVMP